MNSYLSTLTSTLWTIDSSRNQLPVNIQGNVLPYPVYQVWAMLPTVLRIQPTVNDMQAEPLADDVTVSITRKGKEPLQVIVRKGDRIVDLTETMALEKIPDEVKPDIKKFFSSLRSGPFAQWIGALTNFNDGNTYSHWSTLNQLGAQGLVGVNFQDVTTSGLPNTPATNTASESPSEATLKQLDKQVESLATQLAELKRAMHDLRQSIKPTSGTGTK